MKYFNDKSNKLVIYKLLRNFLSNEEMKILEKGMIRSVDSHESIKLSNNVVIRYYKEVGNLYIINNPVIYLFESISENLGDLIKFSLLSGDVEDFIKIISNRNKLISSIFDLFSSSVRSWIISEATDISIRDLNDYQFADSKYGHSRTVLALEAKGTELEVFTNDLNNFNSLTTKRTDVYSIAKCVNEFIEKRI